MQDAWNGLPGGVCGGGGGATKRQPPRGCRGGGGGESGFTHIKGGGAK